MLKLVQLGIVVVGFCLNAHSAQESSTFDVFPLRKGLCYDYTYYYEYQDYALTYLVFLSTDSGSVRYTVLDSVASGDTATIWSILQHAVLSHRRYEKASEDTAYRTDDTTYISLLESRIGNHPLSCSGIVWSFSLMDAEPRVMRFSDSGSVLISRPYLPNPPIVGTDSLWFSSDRGYLRRSSNKAIWGGMSHTVYLVEVSLRNVMSIDEGHSLAASGSYALMQNFPNPFNPSTTIRYGLPNRSHVTLTVFNTLGQQVAILQNGELDAGYHEVGFVALGLSSGVYFYRIQSGEFVQSRRCLFVR